MKILICNVGSTSLKFKLYDMPACTVLSQGKVERVGSLDDAVFQYENLLTGKAISQERISIPDYRFGIEKYLERLTDSEDGVLSSINEIERVGYKTTLSKGYFGTHELTDDVIAGMRDWLPLAMLLAAIMTMGNLGENYELLAMKSAGMSLVRITKPLIILVSVIAVGSFFIGNNLVPYANKKVYSIIYDIRQQKQSLEFQDGLFFNGIDNMSIRVSRQEPETHLLRDVLIYDNRLADGNMNTIVADSGYIRLSDDKRFLLVTLFNGEMYEQTRNSQWFTQSRLRHHIFDKQDQTIPMEGFAMQRSDANQFSNSQTKNINELQQDIDSLEILVNNATTRSYEPLLKEQIFSRDNSVLPQPDSLRKDKSNFGTLVAMDSLSALKLRDKERIWNQARTLAKSSRNMFSFDESAAKEALNQLYRSKVEWHKKISLPVSIMIFFLIGAPLGAIIRKGGLGLPVVVSIIFFVIYYIISLSGEKLAKEGSWEAVYGIWLSTFILTPIAVYLTYKATNDSALLDTDWYAGRLKALNERMRPAINKLKNAIKLKRNGKKHDSE